MNRLNAGEKGRKMNFTLLLHKAKILLHASKYQIIDPNPTNIILIYEAFSLFFSLSLSSSLPFFSYL
jgi:hypothetical protein